MTDFVIEGHKNTITRQHILYISNMPYRYLGIYIYAFTKYISIWIYNVDIFYKHLNMYVNVFVQGKQICF